MKNHTKEKDTKRRGTSALTRLLGTREIRFMAFHATIGEVIDVDEINLFEREVVLSDGDILGMDALGLMQFTGLQDNSVEHKDIFEGDILFCEEQDEYLEVYYQNGAYRVLFSFDNELTSLTDKIIKANCLVKVGNVFENADLLECT